MKKIKPTFACFIAVVVLVISTISIMSQDGLNDGKFLFSISDIKPVGKSIVLTPTDNLKQEGKVTSYTSPDSKKYLARLVASFAVPNRFLINAGIGDFVIGESGTELLNQRKPSDHIISASLTVWKDNDGDFVLSTQMKEIQYSLHLKLMVFI